MTLSRATPHEKYKDLDVQRFLCECGAVADAVMPRCARP